MAKVSVEVSFDTFFDTEEMPTSYTDPDFLEEVIKEAVEDAMNDLGAEDTKKILVSIEGLY
jgi:DNA-binding protein YbaB